MNRFVSLAAFAVGAGAFLALRRQSRRQHGSSAGRLGSSSVQPWEDDGQSLQSGSLQSESSPFSSPSTGQTRMGDLQSGAGQTRIGEPLFTSGETRSGESLFTTDKPRSGDPTI